MINIAIADDHEMLSSTLAEYFSSKPAFNVVGCYTTTKETINSLTSSLPDILLLDLSMPEAGKENTYLISGLDVLQYIKEKSLPIKTIILSNYDNYSLIKASLKKGAVGYLLKTEKPKVLEQALVEVFQGKTFFSVEIKRKLDYPTSSEKEEQEHGRPVVNLSKREKEVLDYISKGFTTENIAMALKLHKDTIADYRNMLFKKFKANNAPHLIRLAAECRILKLD